MVGVTICHEWVGTGVGIVGGAFLSLDRWTQMGPLSSLAVGGIRKRTL